MKACKCCGIKKTLEEFHRHPQCVDGRQSKCKECCRLKLQSPDQKRKPKPATEIDMTKVISRIEYKRTAHGLFPMPAKPLHTKKRTTA